MRAACRLAVPAFTTVYAVALALFVVGNFGWFGVERDPLAGVLLMPLGLPWNRMLDVFPERLWPWLAEAAPAVNLLLLWLLCRRIRARAR